MALNKLSERAQKILAWITPHFEKGGPGGILPIRQQTLAEQFNCSRRTIGRALKELKEAGLLVDLNKRHENRCKLYQVSSLRPRACEAGSNLEEIWIATPAHQSLGVGGSPMAPRNDGLTPEAQRQWELYEKTFRIVFQAPDLEERYIQVACGLRNVTEEMDLWRKTWAGLRVVYGHEPLV